MNYFLFLYQVLELILWKLIVKRKRKVGYTKLGLSVSTCTEIMNYKLRLHKIVQLDKAHILWES